MKKKYSFVRKIKLRMDGANRRCTSHAVLNKYQYYSSVPPGFAESTGINYSRTKPVRLVVLVLMNVRVHWGPLSIGLSHLMGMGYGETRESGAPYCC